YITRVPDWLIVDAQRLRQILFNLVGNALKFTDHGKVTVSVSVSNEKAEAGNSVDLVITVRDTGKGIAAENLQMIFDSFSQIKPSNSTLEGGNGLGLTISQRLAHLMGGQLSVESILNEGSSFTLMLPDVLVGLNNLNSIPDTSSLETRFFDSKVLIVDDIADNRLLLKELISFKGISVMEAASGELALQYAKSHHPDLILLDIRMPGIDGFEVNRRLKDCPTTANIPTIAVSASVYNTDKELFIQAGFHDFLSKPLQFNELLSILHKYLDVKYSS
ncbi:MAG: hybrid sensor histidine kinase/response regulator, partial [Bacteroidetes bacterium HGW-Bacteroidetes-22]